jgi:hypothetical protein
MNIWDMQVMLLQLSKRLSSVKLFWPNEIFQNEHSHQFHQNIHSDRKMRLNPNVTYMVLLQCPKDLLFRVNKQQLMMY